MTPKKIPKIKVPRDVKKLPLTRQRRYQIALERSGLCRACAEPLVNDVSRLCGNCLARARELKRRRTEAQDRHMGAKSYTKAVLSVPAPPRDMDAVKQRLQEIKDRMRQLGMDI